MLNAKQQFNVTLESCLEAARKGWPVYPIKEGMKGKPLGKWIENATTDEAIIRSWFESTPYRNYLITCGGEAGLVVIDVDSKEAQKFYDDLRMPPTRTVRTPRGGRHYYFQYKGNVKFKNDTGKKLFPKIDVKTNGGYVVGPGSRLVEVKDLSQVAGYYTLELDLPLADLPESIALALVGATKLWVLEEQLHRIANAKEGSRNDLLNKISFDAGIRVRDGMLDRSLTEEKLIDAAIKSGLSPEECKNTVNSGLSAGMKSLKKAEDKPNLTVVGKDEPDAIIYAKDGSISAIASNVLALFTQTEFWAKAWEYSEFYHTTRWARDCPVQFTSVKMPQKGEQFAEHHLAFLQMALTKKYQTCWSSDSINAAVNAAAKLNVVNELQDYLADLKWDGVPRVDNLLTLAFGIPESKYASLCTSMTLIGAVARAMDPGCQMDTVFVMSGAQGAGKTTFLKILGGEWYLGNLPDLHNNDSMQCLRGKWIVEIGELDAFKGKAMSTIKDYITRRVDTFRPSYARLPVDRPRSIVFCGTTNKETFLQDSTGNRRFFPINLPKHASLNQSWLIENRDQIWAEAVGRYMNGEAWFPQNEEMIQASEDIKQDFLSKDVWFYDVAVFVEENSISDTIRIDEILSDCLGLAKNKWTVNDQRRVASIMRMLGWEYRQMRRGNIRYRAFVKP